LPISIGLVMLMQLEGYYRSVDAIYQQDEKFREILRQQTHQRACQISDYYQIESLFSIFSLLRLRYPLPPMREWAISPDFAKQLIAIIYERNPQVIVEMSSGISTVIMGYCLEALGSGQIIALEHDERYAKISSSNVQNHELQEIAQVVYAPLKTVEINNQTWRWYDTAALLLTKKIDLLVIDGPPGDLQPLSRYPALPLLFDALNDHCVVIMDDGERADEQKIVELWQQEFNFEVEKIDNEKGAFVLRRKDAVEHSFSYSVS
jgi:predicted O-methyltransferase YrrM